MSLDVLTDKGKKYKAHEDETARMICAKLNCISVECPSADAPIDRVFTRDGKVVALAEIKSREMSLDELREYGSYLVTYKKILMGVGIAQELGVPFFLFVRLLKSGQIVYWQIDTDTLRDVEVRETKTQATCNGGSAIRDNAYLPLDIMVIQ